MKNSAGHPYKHVVVVKGVTSSGALWVNDPENLTPVEVGADLLNRAVILELPFLYKLTAGVL